MPPLAQTLGQAGEAFGGFLGQDLARLGRAQSFRGGEGCPQEIALGPVSEVVKRQRVDLLDGVRPVGVDADGATRSFL